MALEHLSQAPQFLGPSQVRAPLLDLSYSPYYPEVQAACSGATAVPPGAGTTISIVSRNHTLGFRKRGSGRVT